jgi:hypothetical protein
MISQWRYYPYITTGATNSTLGFALANKSGHYVVSKIKTYDVSGKKIRRRQVIHFFN